MSQARQELAMRRQQLVARSSAIRAQLVLQSTAFGPWLALGDQVRDRLGELGIIRSKRFEFKPRIVDPAELDLDLGQ